MRKRLFCFVFYSVVLQECYSQWGQNELEQWSAGLDLSPSRAGQSALFDGEADIKQLPLWAALRQRCYRSMGHTLVTPPNSFSTLSKQRLLCIYLRRELVLHNSIELLNSICGLIYRLVGESKWKVNLITQCVAFEHVFSSIDILLLEWTYYYILKLEYFSFWPSFSRTNFLTKVLLKCLSSGLSSRQNTTKDYLGANYPST